MSDAQYYGEPKPYAFSPVYEPEYFEGVLFRRFVAFLIDALIICVPIGLAALLIFVLGFVTFGVGWFLFGLLSPGFVVWGLVYTGLTLDGPHSATIGMRTMGIDAPLADVQQALAKALIEHLGQPIGAGQSEPNKPTDAPEGQRAI